VQSWGHVRLVRERGGHFPRCDALFESVQIVVLETRTSPHQVRQVRLDNIGRSPITPSHVAEKFAGLPNLQPEILFLGAALSKLNSHRCSAT
jgi:hypothetical protein